jgi:hypothetical protein
MMPLASAWSNRWGGASLLRILAASTLTLFSPVHLATFMR